MTIPIVFSLKLWDKIRRLSPKERSRLLSKIRIITATNIANNQIKKIGENYQRVIFRIRYNLNYRIIATLIKDKAEKKFIKIVDFIPHSKLDQGDYYLEGLGNFTIEDIANLDNETLIEETIWQDNLWTFDHENIAILLIKKMTFSPLPLIPKVKQIPT